MVSRRRPSPPPRPRRSAFAAAFLSFLFPGLGHAYLGRWTRAVLWAVLPILALAAAAGVALGPNRAQVLTNLVDPDILLAVLGIIVLDLLYRLASLIDAWRLARVPGVGSPTTRMLSTAGMGAIVIVLVASHVAVAQPVLFAYDTVMAFDGTGGDEREVPTIEDLGPQWAAILRTASEPTTGGPVATPPAEIPEEYVWDGQDRLDILLIGIDSGRRGSSTFLTDTMIVVSVDPRTGKLAFISLPRDTAGIPLPRDWGARGACTARRTTRRSTRSTRPPASARISSRATTASAATTR